MLTYEELISDETRDDIAARILGYLADGGLPTGSWAPAPVGLENLRLQAVATAVQALMAKRVGGIARGRLLATATDVPVADGGDGPWLSLVGQEVFRIAKRAAATTIKYVALYSNSGTAQPAFDFEPGDLVVRSPATGNRYRSIDGGHFDGSFVAPPATSAIGALVLRFEAETAGQAFADPANTITEMVTARAGVLCTNVRPTMYARALLLGTSTGAVAADFDRDPVTGDYVVPAYTSLVVRVTASGDLGGGAWSYRTPGGAWVAAGPLAARTVVAGTVVGMTNSPVSPSFHAGDLFVLNVASDTYRQGADEETDAAFAQACRYRHVQISDVPVAGAVALMARSASPEIARVSADADIDVPGLTVITMASAVGTASPGALEAVQAFVGARLRGYQGVGASAVANAPEERALAVSAQPFAVTPGGTVFCARGRVADAKVAADRAWLAYLASVPIGQGQNATVELARLEQVIADAGADDVDGTTLNAGAIDLLVPAGQVAVPADGSSISTSMVWVPT